MTLITGHPHGRNCICESCLKAIGLTRTLRIVEPDGTEHYSRIATDAARLTSYPANASTVVLAEPVPGCDCTECTIKRGRGGPCFKANNPVVPCQFVSCSNERAAPPPVDRFAQLRELRELCGYVEDGSSTSVTISQDDATREWCVRVGKIAYYGGSLTAAFNLAVRDNE